MSGRGTGQVCDRCRLKKIKCDGKFPACSNCVASTSPCVVSAKLRRKTKLRGFRHSTDDAEKQRLEAENDALRRQLDEERKTREAHQHHVSALNPSSLQHPQSATMDHYGPVGPDVSAESRISERMQAALVIRHMGRLVVDGEGNERFSGSTTGVHFILTVEQALKKKSLIRDRMPEDCFRLHFLHHHPHALLKPPLEAWCGHAELAVLMRQTLDQSLSFYARQIIAFGEKWTGICPVVAESDLLRDVSDALGQLCQTSEPTSSRLVTTCLKISAVLLVNGSSTYNDGPEEKLSAYRNLAAVLLPLVEGLGTLDSLQAVALLSLYVQVTGQVLLMPRLNGVLVQSAQALGLHRHSRRFRFCAGQIEIRKRLWWWIYGFDKIISITHGTPQLIQGDDVDVDYPLDCYLDQADASQLNLPLPGETTPANEFIAFAHLSRIFATILHQLYTTTHRRHGSEKITKLYNDLQTWCQHFRSCLVDPGASNTGGDFPRLWLSALAAFAEILIHRPGLTFDETTSQFRNCLDHCTRASTALIQLCCSQSGRHGLMGIVPFGPATLLQCGLMHVYSRLHGRSVDPDSRPVPSDSSAELIGIAAQLLQNYAAAHSTPGEGSIDRTRRSRDALSTSSSLLSFLVDLVISEDQQTGCLATPGATSLPPTESPPWFQHPLSPMRNQAPALDMLTTSSLEDMNQLDYLGWVFDNPFDAPTA